MATLFNSLSFVFTILFLPNYRIKYYYYIVKWCSFILFQSSTVMGAVVSHLKHILNVWSVNMYSFFLINLANCIQYHSDLRFIKKPEHDLKIFHTSFSQCSCYCICIIILYWYGQLVGHQPLVV